MKLKCKLCQKQIKSKKLFFECYRCSSYLIERNGRNISQYYATFNHEDEKISHEEYFIVRNNILYNIYISYDSNYIQYFRAPKENVSYLEDTFLNDLPLSQEAVKAIKNKPIDQIIKLINEYHLFL